MLNAIRFHQTLTQGDTENVKHLSGNTSYNLSREHYEQSTDSAHRDNGTDNEVSLNQTYLEMRDFITPVSQPNMRCCLNGSFFIGDPTDYRRDDELSLPDAQAIRRPVDDIGIFQIITI